MDEQTKKGIKQGVLDQGVLDWLDEELQESFDEDYELDLSESELLIELKNIYREKHPPTLKGPQYFKPLISLALGDMPQDEYSVRFELGSGLFVNTVCPETAARRLRQAADFTSLHQSVYRVKK